RVIRLNLAAAKGQTTRLSACWPYGADVVTVALSPDGKTVATGHKNGKVQLWDAQSGKPLGEALVHQDAVLAVAFRYDGKVLATGSGNAWESSKKRGEVHVWDTATGRGVGPVIGCQGPVHTVAFSPDGQTLLLGGLDGKSRKGEVRLWD